MISNELAGMIFQGLGILALLSFGWSWLRQRRVAAWPSTVAEILSSATETDVDANSVPRIRYRYQVGNEIYESEQIYPSGVVATSGTHAEDLVRAYPPARKLRVHYCADNPADAVLINKLPLWVLLMQCVAGLVFLIFGKAFFP